MLPHQIGGTGSAAGTVPIRCGAHQPEAPVEVTGLPVARVSDRPESHGLQHALTRGAVDMDPGRDRLKP